MATLDSTPYPIPEPDYSALGEIPYDQMPDALALADLQQKASTIDLDNGEIVGGILRWQRADGYAMYLVTKDRPLTLQHIPFGDAWTVEAALIRGLNRNDVLTMLRRERNLSRLFGSK